MTHTVDRDSLAAFDPWMALDTDAMHWAEAFVAIYPDAKLDIDTLLAWFANAIEVGRSAGYHALLPETPGGGIDTSNERRYGNGETFAALAATEPPTLDVERLARAVEFASTQFVAAGNYGQAAAVIAAEYDRLGRERE